MSLYSLLYIKGNHVAAAAIFRATGYCFIRYVVSVRGEHLDWFDTFVSQCMFPFHFERDAHAIFTRPILLNCFAGSDAE